ncbi:MAG: glycosyltransferase family 2 protein [Saprospiraceae bacterium]|nr:glycosyltransferase family 2 protein [Saprospiraceae bacterium]
MNVSVIIPVYNAESFVEAAVRSAVQHLEVKQIILVEDGSTDNSLEVCRRIARECPLIELYRHPGGINCGAGASRNLGLAHVTQEFTCFLDADDTFKVNRFRKESAVFNHFSDADGVYGATGVIYHDEVGARAWETHGHSSESITTIRTYLEPGQLFEYLIGYPGAKAWNGHFCLDALTLRSASLDRLGIQFDAALRLHQDSAFILKCALLMRLYPGETDAPVALRGVHRNNRFIHHTDLASSKRLQFEHFLGWCKQTGIQTKYRLHLQIRLCQIKPSRCSYAYRMWLSVRLAIADPTKATLIFTKWLSEIL